MTRQVFKAHGTGNDFVVYADPQNALPPTAADIALLCDRHLGIGADGLIRLVPYDALPYEQAAAFPRAAGGVWVMDYYNADGTPAEMCGNGVRVAAHILRVAELVPSDTEELTIATRAGVKDVTVYSSPQNLYRVDMGSGVLHERTENGHEPHVLTHGIEVARPGLLVDMGNPHTVVTLANTHELASAELAVQPEVRPLPTGGTNIEYMVIEPNGDPHLGRVHMRVHERGVGETYACGTGACAVALAAAHWAGEHSPSEWEIVQPGGAVRIRVTPHTVFLTGPAEIVATLHLVPALLHKLSSQWTENY